MPLAADPFLTHLVVEKGRSELTLRAYRQDLRRYAAFLTDLDLEVDDVREADVDAFVAVVRSAGLATSSVIRVLGTVRAMHRFLAADGLAPGDPTAHLEPPRRPAALPRGLSEAEVTALLDAVGTAALRPPADVGSVGDALDVAVVMRDRALLEVLYSSGMRVSEACGLRFGDLDLDVGFVRVLGKRDKERLVPVGRPAERALGEYLDGARRQLLGARSIDRDAADAVFLGRRGRRISRQAVWDSIRRWAAAAGLHGEVSPHVLRHSCATHMLDHGADIRTVQELLGHASVSTTQIYTRVATDRLMQAYRDAHPRAAHVAARVPSEAV